MMRPRNRVVAVVLTLGYSVSAYAATEYSFTDLGSVPNFLSSEVITVNDSGEVHGVYHAGPENKYFRWTATNGMVDLGTIVGFETNPGAMTFVGVDQQSAFSFMRNDQVLRRWSPLSGEQELDPELVSIGDVRTSPNGTFVVGIDNWNQPAGFVWSAATGRQPLNTPDGRPITPKAVNDDGTVVGFVFRAGSISYLDAVQKKAGLPAEILHPLSGEALSMAEYVNSIGNIVGSYGNYQPRRGFIWSETGGYQPLPFVGNHYDMDVVGLTDSGTVVFNDVDQYGRLTPYIWNQSTGTRSLAPLLDSASSGWTLIKVVSASPGGRIIGQARRNGQERSFLLTPVPELETVVPVAIGLAVFARRLTQRTGLKRT